MLSYQVISLSLSASTKKGTIQQSDSNSAVTSLPSIFDAESQPRLVAISVIRPQWHQQDLQQCQHHLRVEGHLQVETALSIPRCNKNLARGGASEYSVRRSLAIHPRPLLPFRVLYSSQRHFQGFSLPDIEPISSSQYMQYCQCSQLFSQDLICFGLVYLH